MNRVTVIAEAGVNHNGELDRALSLVDAAARAGADYVKFQTFNPTSLASRFAARADYQVRNIGDGAGSDGGQLAMLRALALSHADHFALRERSTERGVGFMSSAFDPESVRFLVDEMDLPVLKLGSGELTNAPMLWQIARTGRPLILSTGMADLEEVRQALDVLAHGVLHHHPPRGRDEIAGLFAHHPGILSQRITLLHCTTDYPCPADQVNLAAMDCLARTFGLPVGYSDHTEGIEIAVAAAAHGARVIEKHFTLDRGLPGPDHAASLEPDELQAMVAAIRRVETALGDGTKRPMPAEQANATVARKSLVAARTIDAGELFSTDNLTVKRPGSGRSPLDYWDLLGTAARRAYGEDETID
jgi:N-acetylneuraminate synthase